MSIPRVLGIPAMILAFGGGIPAQVPGTSNQGNQGSPAASLAVSAMNIQAINSSGSQNPLLGGIPTGNPTGGVIPLSLSETLKRGLDHNLGTVLSEQSLQATRGARLIALSQLLPRVTTGINEMQEQVNLAAFGFQASPGMPDSRRSLQCL